MSCTLGTKRFSCVQQYQSEIMHSMPKQEQPSSTSRAIPFGRTYCPPTKPEIQRSSLQDGDRCLFVAQAARCLESPNQQSRTCRQVENWKKITPILWNVQATICDHARDGTRSPQANGSYWPYSCFRSMPLTARTRTVEKKKRPLLVYDASVTEAASMTSPTP